MPRPGRPFASLQHLLLLAGAAAAILPATAVDELPEPGTPLPPVARAETNFRIGERFLAGLPDGTAIEVTRADGTRLTFRLEGGRFKTELPAARLDGGGQAFVSPVGYRIELIEIGGRKRIRITAPGGAYTDLWPAGDRLIASEGDSGLWSLPSRDGAALRLPDGTRIDVLPRKPIWEAITLAGERFRFDLGAGRWKALPSVPSPPLVPDLKAAYVAGDGDDWRLPVAEEHVTFAWNWYPYGLPSARLVEDLRDPRRKHDLDFYFNGLPEAQTGIEAGAYMFARRFCLGGGDRLTFEIPGSEPQTVLLLPGPIDPDFFLLKMERPTTLGAPVQMPRR